MRSILLECRYAVIVYIYIYIYTCSVLSAAKVLSGRIAYSVPAPAATASVPKFLEDDNHSDYNVCDEDFESEEDEELKRGASNCVVAAIGSYSKSNSQGWHGGCLVFDERNFFARPYDWLFASKMLQKGPGFLWSHPN